VTLPDVLRLERPLIGLDLETTTANPQTARIVEIGLEIMRPGQPVKEWRALINPGVPIPPEATAAHHITDEMVRDAPRFTPELAANLIRGFEHADFAGYNAHFDLEVLQREIERAGYRWDYEDARIIDGLRLWQVTEPRSLTDACKLEGVELLDAHSALADAKAATRFIAARLRRFSHLPRDVQRLHDLCFGDRYDAAGKLRWRDGELVFGFGKHRGEPVRSAPRDYLSFILRSDFSDKVKDAARRALAGTLGRKDEHDEPSQLS
jgi:DNA polymerase-3 subunit epsilon